MSWRFLVPNFFTAASLALGAGSVLCSLEGWTELAAWFILWCVLLDKVDGTAARLLKATSRFGCEFDSLADLVSFGFAPAVLVYQAGRQHWGVAPGQGAYWVLVTSSGLYALLTAVRLARFNSIEHEPGERWFSGIPTTLAGAIVGSGALVALKCSLSPEVGRILPLVAALLGLGMVSGLPVPKIIPRRNRWFNWFQVANIVAIYLCGILMVVPEYPLALCLIVVLVGGGYGLAIGPAARQTHAKGGLEGCGSEG